jgi:hypothetical protein
LNGLTMTKIYAISRLSVFSGGIFLFVFLSILPMMRCIYCQDKKTLQTGKTSPKQISLRGQTAQGGCCSKTKQLIHQQLRSVSE